MEGANMAEIVAMAQKVATNITQNQTEPLDPKNLDMGKIIADVTKNVQQMVTPEFLEKMGGGVEGDCNDDLCKVKHTKKGRQVADSKIKKIEELNESDDETDEIKSKTKDLHFTLNVSLEDLYLGKQKKLAVRRKKIVSDGKKKQIVEEKKKITVNIEPGMFDEQIITFNKQADEKEGYETGDIVITLCCAEHEEYEREGDNLIIEKEISLSEAFECKLTMRHLDGNDINISANKINMFGEEIELFRKLKNYGMPILNENDKFGDLIIKFKPVFPLDLSNDKLEKLKELFPPINITKHSEEIKNYDLELVTESDFEFSDDESSDEDDDEYSEYSDENNSNEESEASSNEEKIKSKNKKM